MAESLDLPQFFRRAPHEWLQRYFGSRGVLDDFDWTTVSVRKVDELVEAWLRLSEAERTLMLEDFFNIKMLATPAGKLQMIDEAPFHGLDNVVATKLAELDDIYACAFWLMLTHEKCWNGAVFYAAADGKQRRYWRKRNNMPVLGRQPTDEDGKALGEAITALFRKKEARGDYCVVRQYRRGKNGEREYYFAYPQDHKQNTIQFQDGEMIKRPYNPAFEIIFVHNDAERTLTIWHRGRADRVKDLQVAFAKAVLKQDIPKESARDDRVYDLSCFLDRAFEFRPAPELGIAKVEVRKLGVRILGEDAHTHSIELAANTRPHVLAERVAAATSGVPTTMVRVARVGCLVIFEPKGDERDGKERRFELVWPASCSLQNDPHGVVIERMLADHGIEPRSPPADG